MIDLSIIIPIYNVEKFLTKCINSVLDNDWSGIVYEIILVDDGSPDRSLDIALNFKNKYDNIKVISQKNKGLGGARNTGINNAEGKYLFFLDSDDYFLKDKFQEVVKIALENNIDILEFGALRVNENYQLIDNIFCKKNSDILDGLTYVGHYSFENSACNKIYNRAFLLQNAILFFEKTYVEDAPFNAEAFAKAKSVMSVSKIPVAFYQNRNSITRQNRTGENLRKFINDSIKVTRRIKEIEVSVTDRRAEKEFQKRISIFTSGTILMILKSKFTATEKKKYLNDLRNAGLYPIKNSTGIIIRDFFILIVNNRFILSFLFKIL